ncbi:hypothetical protein, partial [Enterobacter bugandensis]|uniref:hypothetical protein n=1 Tax=Enterobacter bugandensis TaxID=881260 RepID=UPI000664DCCF
VKIFSFKPLRQCNARGEGEAKTIDGIPVVFPDKVLSHHLEPYYKSADPACREAVAGVKLDLVAAC